MVVAIATILGGQRAISQPDKSLPSLPSKDFQDSEFLSFRVLPACLYYSQLLLFRRRLADGRASAVSFGRALILRWASQYVEAMQRHDIEFSFSPRVLARCSNSPNLFATDVAQSRLFDSRTTRRATILSRRRSSSAGSPQRRTPPA